MGNLVIYILKATPKTYNLANFDDSDGKRRRGIYLTRNVPRVRGGKKKEKASLKSLGSKVQIYYCNWFNFDWYCKEFIHTSFCRCRSSHYVWALHYVAIHQMTINRHFFVKISISLGCWGLGCCYNLNTAHITGIFFQHTLKCICTVLRKYVAQRTRAHM